MVVNALRYSLIHDFTINLNTGPDHMLYFLTPKLILFIVYLLEKNYKSTFFITISEYRKYQEVIFSVTGSSDWFTSCGFSGHYNESWLLSTFHYIHCSIAGRQQGHV